LVLGAAEAGVESCEFLGRRFLEIARLELDPDVGGLVRGAQALVLIEAVGSEEEVETRLAKVGDLSKGAGIPLVFASDPRSAERMWRLRHSASPTIAKEAAKGRFSVQFIEDSVVPPRALAAYLEELEGVLRDQGFDPVTFGHAGDGNAHVNPLVDLTDPKWKVRVRSALEAVTGIVSSLGGTLTGEHGDGRLRAPLLDRIWPPDVVAAFRVVKDALDPRGILNPGVILPLPNQDPLEGLDPKGPGGLPAGPDVLQFGGFG
jgi:FAD/FMN-containing dehydrogenase